LVKLFLEHFADIVLFDLAETLHNDLLRGLGCDASKVFRGHFPGDFIAGLGFAVSFFHGAAFIVIGFRGLRCLSGFGVLGGCRSFGAGAAAADAAAALTAFAFRAGVADVVKGNFLFRVFDHMDNEEFSQTFDSAGLAVDMDGHLPGFAHGLAGGGEE
jgi:hypothetical protein